MVTRSHLKLVEPESALPGARPQLLAGLGTQRDAIQRVLDFVEPLYATRTLATGEPILEHVLAVAQTLSELKLDGDALTAALVYPAYDLSTKAALSVREKFGGAVAELAEGVVKMAQIGALTSRGVGSIGLQQQSAQLESLRKMLLAMVQDVRVVLIKLAAHLQDLRSLVKAPESVSRTSAAAITRDIFAPLANRLGVWHLKWELEDLAFRILEP